MKDELTVAAVQLTSTVDVEANLERSAEWVRRAAAGGARLVALPENFGYLGRDRDKLPFAQEIEDGPFLAPLRELARSEDIYVLAGGIPERGPDERHTYNTAVLVGPDGETRASYRKIHLFDIDVPGAFTYVESHSVAPGDRTVVADVDGWPVGLSVCYDLRFPELYRRLVNDGARVVFVPSAFTLHTGKDHWDVLLRARAIENQCYVVAPGQFGDHQNGRHSWGKTQIIDPWGMVLSLAPEREGLAIATLVAADQDQIWRNLPCQQHKSAVFA